MIPTSILFIGIVLFLVWNNWPDLVERVGIFLVAHAQSVRERSKKYVDLKTKVA